MSLPTSLLDLPVDILLLIFPYLDAPSFLSLTATCKALHHSDFLHEPRFWATLVHSTFRVPNQPLVQNDGARWHKLFRRLKTQTRMYTWGNNGNGCLGHSYVGPMAAARRMPRRGRAARQRHISWPHEMEHTENLGVISDLQCGGWSTSMLTSQGVIYVVGVLDGMQLTRRHAPYMQSTHVDPTPLRFPPGLPQPGAHYEPVTAIKQFSAGRQHILAVSDSGRIWSWQDIDHAGLTARFIHHDTVEGQDSGTGVVKKVVAGWSKSAALIEGVGIVVWEPLRRSQDETEIEDAALVLESAVVPSTRYHKNRQRRYNSSEDTDLADTVGEVLNFIVLEEVILFNTSLGKVFVSQIIWNDDTQRINDPIEVPLPVDAGSAAFATDIQGTFRSLAVFTKSGAVLTSSQDQILPMVLDPPPGTPNDAQHIDDVFARIPALQNKQVIALAFGDYHFHALHAPGHITSYGREPQSCGALGLGGQGDPEGRLRGIRYQGIGGDGRLVPHAYTEGRRVWFEREKRDWITFLTSGGADAQEAAERLRIAIGSPDVHGQGEVSEWIEQEGSDWEGKFGVRAEGDDGLPAYFTLSVAAAGWHSGALVLVNQPLADKITEAVELLETETASGEAEESQPPAKQGPSEDAPDTPISNGVVNSVVAQVSDFGRWFLGLAPYNSPQSIAEQSQHHQLSSSHANIGAAPPGPTAAQSPNVASGPDPVRYGASPRKGVKYIWADDHFPRLRLSNGTEMPGNVPFDTWRFGRPQWDLDAALS